MQIKVLFQPLPDDAGNLRPGAAVSKREAGARHGRSLDRALEQPASFGHDPLRRSSHQPRIARSNRLGTLGLFAQHQQGRAESCRLLLNASRVAKHEVAVADPPDKLRMIGRFNQLDARVPISRDRIADATCGFGCRTTLISARPPLEISTIAAQID